MIANYLFTYGVIWSSNTGISTMMLMSSAVIGYFISIFRYNEQINAISLIGTVVLVVSAGYVVWEQQKVYNKWNQKDEDVWFIYVVLYFSLPFYWLISIKSLNPYFQWSYKIIYTTKLSINLNFSLDWTSILFLPFNHFSSTRFSTLCLTNAIRINCLSIDNFSSYNSYLFNYILSFIFYNYLCVFVIIY